MGVGGRCAPAPRIVLLVVTAALGPLHGCSAGGGSGGGDGLDSAGTDGGPAVTCTERRARSGRTSTFSAEPIRMRVGRTARAIARRPPRSALLPPASARPPRPRMRRSTGDRAVGLRVLLAAPDEQRASYQAAAAALQRIAVPHDVLLSASESLERERLYDESGACRYAGIILSHSDLAADDGTGWHSTFSDEEWQLLAEYEQTCGAREVIWYADPSDDVGLTRTGSFGEEARETATLTDAGAARFPYLVRDAAIPIQEVFGYRARVSDASTTQPLLVSSRGDVLAAVHTRADGTEVLAVTMDSGPTALHSQLLEFGIVAWLSRGLFIGARRLYLAPQIDDVFLASALWTESGGQPTYRMTGDDVGHLLEWSSQLPSRLPAGSTVRNQLAFNGAGSLPAAFADQSVVAALLAAEQQFFWINHTWDHENLDAASEELAREAIARNCERAAEWRLGAFRCSEAVTPEVTGLDNPDAVAGLVAAGVRHVISDSSVTEELDPLNPGNNPSPNVGRRNPFDPSLLQIPRHPTNIFFNCSLPAEEVGLYNELYRDYFGRDLTYAEILDVDTDLALSDLLSYDVDPLMFHQANLRFWSDGSRWRSLYTDWIDRLAARYTELVDLPILGLDMNAIARVMEERAALDGCGVTATLSPDRTRIHLESVGACVVPITGLAAPDAGDVELYGGVATTRVTMDACDARDIDVDLGG
jgi:hypothetical protein